MAIFKKSTFIGTIAALALCAGLIPQAAGAAEAEGIIIKEKSVISDTVVDPNMPAPADGMVTPERPFSNKRETLPAGTAVIDVTPSGPNVINYASNVSSRTPTELVLNTVISKPEDDATLSQLASKIYMENGGPKYDNVTIFWHIGEKPQPEAPWGRTDIAKGSTVFEIVKLQQ